MVFTSQSKYAMKYKIEIESFDDTLDFYISNEVLNFLKGLGRRAGVVSKVNFDLLPKEQDSAIKQDTLGDAVVEQNITSDFYVNDYGTTYVTAKAESD